MGYKDDNMVLDVYSGGFTIEPFSESIGKLSYIPRLSKNTLQSKIDGYFNGEES